MQSKTPSVVDLEHAPLRLELKRISKSFPGVLANDDVSFSVKSGEIHALLGENGAGKSTLVKMIYGIQSPDSGSMSWNGTELLVANPKAARKLGIGMVFQHFSLFEALTVLENIALGMDGGISQKQLETKVRHVMKNYGLVLDPHRIVATLSVGERQRIEIVRALLLNPKLLIMDEPTSVLTPQEVDQLFGTLRQLAKEGCSILYISHKLNEIKALCDVATILRHGKVVGACDPKQETSTSMAEMMIGGTLNKVTKETRGVSGDVLLKVEGLAVGKTDQFSTELKNVGFEVRRGEILGIAGVAGNGQNELLSVLSGELPGLDSTMILVDGNDISNSATDQRRMIGVCSVPEERNGHAAVADFTLAENAILTARQRKNLVRGGLVLHKKSIGYAAEVISAFDVKATGPKALAGSLSGGNLQKFIMGREIMQTPDVLLVSQPTWGVDAGAASAIHQALVDLASAGSAIVVISQDLDELLLLSDTLSVINAGQLSPPMRTQDASVEQIGLLMGGVQNADDVPPQMEKTAPLGAQHV